MNKFETKSQSTQAKLKTKKHFPNSYYAVLGLHPSATSVEIRKAYRELSKLYHPDTTNLPQLQAKRQFQELNQAYITLSHPERRSLYDLKIGYSHLNVIQSNPQLNHSNEQFSDSAYLSNTDRPLSAGEIFALFMMGITLIGCLLLAITIAWLRGDALY